MKIIPAEVNIFKSMAKLLELIGIRFTSATLKSALENHPDTLSISALSDVLNEYKVPNLATRLSPERLHEIPLPALLHLHVGTGHFAPVRKISETVEWYDTERGWQLEPFNDFVHKWSGATLLVEPNEQSGEENYTQNRQKEILALLRWVFMGAGLLLCLGNLLLHLLQTVPFAANEGYYALLATKLIGTAVSIMLVWYGIDANNSFLQSVCQLNKTTNCNNILNSPAAKLTSWLNWSEVGLFYFAGGLLFLLILPIDSIPILWILGVLALPYTFWSVYYQAFVARQWCVFCLSVQILLWIEATIGFWLFKPFTLHDDFFLLLLRDGTPRGLGGFLIAPVLWTFIKPHLQKSFRFDTMERDFQRLKFNGDYLSGLLAKQRNLPPIFEDMKVIEMGNPDAAHTLILVSNPSCAACRRNHIATEKMLQTTDNLNVRIILAANYDSNDDASQVARQILSLPNRQMAEALQKWFDVEGQRFRQWSKTIEGNPNDEATYQQLGLHLRWLELAGVTSTPAWFLNNVELPKFYSPTEIPKLCMAFENRVTPAN